MILFQFNLGIIGGQWKLLELHKVDNLYKIILCIL